jgi:hypothetical protein
MPTCMFAKEQCNCPLAEVAQTVEETRSSVKVDTERKLLAQVLTEIISSAAYILGLKQLTDQIANSIARIEIAMLITESGLNLKECPHYSKDKIPPRGMG